MSSVPIFHFDFENYTTGSNTIVNKGSKGTAFNATIGGNSSVISNDYATGTNCLSLIGEGTSSGGYLQFPGFKWSDITTSPLTYTICFWYKKIKDSITETNARILDFYYDSNTYIYIYFNSTGNLVFKKNDARGFIDTTVVVNTDVCDGRWHHFAILNNLDSLYNQIYIDGVFSTQISHTNTGFSNTNAYTSCYLGRSSTSTDYYATELIDDFRIYNKALTSTEIASLFALYNRPVCNFFIGNPPVNLNLFMLP